MDYSFNTDIAKLYGVDEAIFIHNIYWWMTTNRANGRHYEDGRTWTYNSMKAFAEIFPFWTVNQIRRIIRNLEANGALHIGNYNEKGFDRTQWYALDETVTSIYETHTCICANNQMHVCEQPKGSVQTHTPIPDNKPYINTDGKPDRERALSKQKHFEKPSLKEITSYCLANCFKINAQRFFDFYESNGWMVGKNPMTDWKAAVRTWNSRETGQSNVNPNYDIEAFEATALHVPKYKYNQTG